MKIELKPVSRQVFSWLLLLLNGFLVVLYVNLFVVWDWLERRLEREVLNLLPVILSVLILALILVVLRQWPDQSRKVNWPLVAAGMLGCLAGLLIPDMRYAVKRIHVVEYLFLALLLRLALSGWLNGRDLAVFAFLTASLFGVHDEFLQGFHPSRTFGFRDMAVNVAGALGGTLIWHGARVGERASGYGREAKGKTVWPLVVYLGWLFVAVLALIIPMAAYRMEPLPLWPMVPLCAGLVIWAAHGDTLSYCCKAGVVAVSLLAFALLAYPVASHVAPFSFR